MTAPHHPRFPNDPPDDQLIAAWHSALSGAEIAPRFGLTADRLYMCWYRLKREGRLPGDRRHTQGRAVVSSGWRVPHEPELEANRLRLERATDKFLGLLRAQAKTGAQT